MIEIKSIIFNNGQKGKVFFIDSNPNLGFNNPYTIFLPEQLKSMNLLVNSINTGKYVKKLEDAKEQNLIKASSKCFSKAIACDLGMPLLTPLFPRISGYYSHMLTSSVFHNNVDILRYMNSRRKIEEQLSEEEILEIQSICLNIPEQLVHIIDDAKKVLKEWGINVSEKVIMEGYSAAGKFVTSFTALYPERVKACVSGGDCGLGILPTKVLNGTSLNYPLGIADIPNFNLAEFLKIPQLVYIGDQDYNDPAEVKCNYLTDEDGNYIKDSDGYHIPITDEYGKIVPILNSNGEIQAQYIDCYTDDEVQLIHSLLGSDPQERFDNQEKLYQKYGVNATFKKLPGTHKTIFRNCNESYNLNPKYIVEDFITSILEQIMN